MCEICNHCICKSSGKLKTVKCYYCKEKLYACSGGKTCNCKSNGSFICDYCNTIPHEKPKHFFIRLINKLCK